MVTINGLEPTENAALAYSHVSELDFEVLDYHRCSTRFTCGVGSQAVCHSAT